MRRLASALALTLLLLLVTATAAGAADSVTGTFVVNGKTHLFKQVAVTRTENPAEPGSTYLVVLVSDVPVAPLDRKPARLVELARAGKVRALRVTWKEGFDAVTATPFHDGLEDSGQPTTRGAIIDLRAYDEKRLEAKITSRPLGQAWHFSATLQAAVVPAVSAAEDFREAVPLGPATTAAPVERETRAGGGAGGARSAAPAAAPVKGGAAGGGAAGGGAADATALKRRLGRFGYEATGDAFSHAVVDGHLDAVTLFLQLGMSPDTKDDLGNPLINHAVTLCTREPAATRIEILKALLGAKAAVDPKDENGSTPLLWSVNAQCPTEFAAALLAAGANPNAKAKGGATPLMLAKVFNRTDLIALLTKAGAKQ